MRRGTRNLLGYFLAAALCWLVLGGSRSANAQGIITGSISGTVIDPRGAVIPGASILAKEIHTGAERATTSQGDGSFWFGDVPIGTYTVSITATGFQPLQMSGVRVVTGEAAALGEKKLTLGTTATVAVHENTMVDLDKTDSQVTTTFGSQQLEYLPFAGGMDGVALLIPGVARTLSDSMGDTNGPNFSANGQRGRSINFELDGQSNNDNSVSGPQIYFDNQDALAEIQVITDNFSAQYGRNMGAVVNYVTKSGTNAFHGSGFEFYTGSWLSSFENQQKSPLFGFCAPHQLSTPTRPCNTPTLPRFVDHRFGGTLGGPIMKNKLWFFGSTYWEHAATGVIPSTSQGATTPTPEGLQQLATAFPGNPAVAVIANNGPFGEKAGNPSIVPGSLTTEQVISPSGPVQIQEAQFQRSVATPFTDQEDLGRIDWQPTAADRFYFRYFYQKDQSTGSPAPSVAEGEYVNIPDVNHSVGGDWTRTFSASWVNQIRYSFQQSKLTFEGGSNPGCTTTNMTACPAELVYTGNSTDSNFGLSAGDPQGRTVKTTQVQDNATWIFRNHSIAFGGEWDYQNSPNVFLPTYNGVFLYPDMNALLHDSAGTGLVELANGNPVIPFTEADAALYLQDDWKVRPTLTLNLGLRWEYFGQAVNELHDSSLKQQSGPHPFWNTSLPLAVTTAPKVPSNWKNYEPRLGFAWNPEILNQRLVVRGGFAVNFDPAFYNMFLLGATASPVINQNLFACNGGACLPGNGSFSGASVRSADLQYLSTGGNPAFNNQSEVASTFLNPDTQTYSLGVEYQVNPNVLVSMRYVGNHAIHNFQSVDANPDLQPVAAAFPNVVSPSSLCSDPTQPGYGRPSCAKANLNQVTNGAYAIYNGLQTGIVTRNLHGLTADFAYTYSRTIDNVSEVFSSGSGGTTIAYAQNPLNTNAGERGVSGNSYPSVASLGLTYDLPFYVRQENWKGRVFGGYSFHAIYTYNSGQPYNPYQPLSFTNPVTGVRETSLCDGNFNQSYVYADTCRMVLSNPHAPLNTVAYNAGGTHGYVDYQSTTSIDPTSVHWIVDNSNEAVALNNPYPGSGRNILRGQNFYNIDANLFKTITLTERFSLQLQLNAFNVFNHDYLGTPNPSVAAYNATLGVNPFLSNRYNNSYGTTLGSQQSLPGSLPGNRVFQLGGKVLF